MGASRILLLDMTEETFTPFAVILTEWSIPPQIAALLDVPNLVIPLDASKPRTTFIRQALRHVRQRPGQFGSAHDVGPYMGRATGIVVNYAPNRAVRYDLNGAAIEFLPHVMSEQRGAAGLAQGQCT